MNVIRVTKITVDDKRIDFSFHADGEVGKYLTKYPCFLEYSRSIKDTPKNIAIIPFLGNVLPVAWMFNAEIIVDELDDDFYHAIPKFKQGFVDMYPQIPLKGKLTANKIVKNKTRKVASAAAAFFSGGVDSHHTLIERIKEKPTLVTICGADLDIENEDGWQVVEEHIHQTANDFGLDRIGIKSSFKLVVNNPLLNDYIGPRCHDNWWHGFQHGPGMITCFAPLAYTGKYSKLYIPSTFTKDYRPTCASDPTIDNYVRYCGCETIHNGFKDCRHEKTKQIITYSESTGRKINLRVCYEATDGSNCCNCEKCCRTILSIVAHQRDPRNYGFKYSDRDFKQTMKKFRWLVERRQVRGYYYVTIQNELRQLKKREDYPDSLRWFYDYDFDKYNRGERTARGWLLFVWHEWLPNVERRLRRFPRKVVRKISHSLWPPLTKVSA